MCELVVGCGRPAGDLCGIRNAVLEAVGPEGSEADGGGAEDSSDLPVQLAAHGFFFVLDGIGLG